MDVTVREAVDAAEPRIAGRFKDQPLVEADVRDTLGLTYSYLGEAPLAIRQHERALELRQTKLGPDHPDTLASRNNLAEAYQAAGRTAEAIALHEATLKLRESKLGPDHPDTLDSRNNLAVAYRAAGRTAEAIALHEATLKLTEAKLGPDHPDTLTSRNNLAAAYHAAGRTAEAIALHEATLKLTRVEARARPPRHAHQPQQPRRGLPRRRPDRRGDRAARGDAQARWSRSSGPDHPDTLTSRNNLAEAYLAAGRTAEAIALHEATLKLTESKLGPDHPDTLTSRNNLAAAYHAAGRTAEAIALHEATLKLMEAKLGPDHPDTLTSRNNLAAAYESLGRWAEAEPLRRDVAGPPPQDRPSPTAPSWPATWPRSAPNLLEQARWSEAEPVLRECLAIREKAIPDDWTRYNAMSLLGGALLGQGRYAEAEPLIVPGYEGMKARAAKIPAPAKPPCPEAAERVVRLYEAWGRPEQAAAWKAKLGLADLPADVFARP